MSLSVSISPGARKDAARLSAADARALAALVAALPAIFGHPHRHGGSGLRQLRSGVFEARVSRAVRVVFVRQGEVLLVVLVGNHDDVRRFLRGV